jgi:peptide/nickel transport system permease protein
MLAYILRRILAAIPVMEMVALFMFILVRVASGDPAVIMLGDGLRDLLDPRIARRMR